MFWTLRTEPFATSLWTCLWCLDVALVALVSNPKQVQSWHARGVYGLLPNPLQQGKLSSLPQKRVWKRSAECSQKAQPNHTTLRSEAQDIFACIQEERGATPRQQWQESNKSANWQNCETSRSPSLLWITTARFLWALHSQLWLFYSFVLSPCFLKVFLSVVIWHKICRSFLSQRWKSHNTWGKHTRRPAQCGSRTWGHHRPSTWDSLLANKFTFPPDLGNSTPSFNVSNRTRMSATVRHGTKSATQKESKRCLKWDISLLPSLFISYYLLSWHLVSLWNKCYNMLQPKVSSNESSIAHDLTEGPSIVESCVLVGFDKKMHCVHFHPMHCISSPFFFFIPFWFPFVPLAKSSCFSTVIYPAKD